MVKTLALLVFISSQSFLCRRRHTRSAYSALSILDGALKFATRRESTA